MLTDMNDNQTRSMTMEQNEEISTTTTKQISANFYHKYFALGQLLFQVGPDYVKTM
jgi:hypothetical protein